MKFNQFSYIPVSPEIACQELRSLGFEVSLDASAKANFEAFVRKSFLFFDDTDLALKNWIADTAVSYTHLDVYKRQFSGHLT